MTLFFLTAFLYYYLLFRNKATRSNFLLLVLFAAAAINTRYASIAVIMVPGIDSLIRFLRTFNWYSSLFALSLFALVCAPDFIFKSHTLSSMTETIHFHGWSVKNFFQHTFFTSDGYQVYSFPNICYVFSGLFHPGFLFAGIIFLFFQGRKMIEDPFLRMTGIIFVIYALFIAGLATQDLRFLLLTFPCVIILYASSFFRIADYLWNRKRLLISSVILVIFIQLALFYRAFKPFYSNSLITKEIAAGMKAYPGKTIYTFNIDQGLRAYGVKNEIINLWKYRIDHFKPGSLILFNYINSYRQWKDMNPVFNFESAKEETGFHLKEHFKAGWDLYEIRN
jgi:4-amino-4-deoxy-L-arabinose transferase-like glycosyltransferase